MSEQKQPKAGEWWRDDIGRIAFIAFDERTIGSKSSIPIVAYHDGPQNGDWYSPTRFIEHLPDCTGWDWQPEVFPQYWTTVSPFEYAYCLRVDRDVYRMVKLDGTMENERSWNSATLGGRKQITKEQAESLVEKPTVKVPLRLWIKRDVIGMHMSVPVVARRDYAGGDMAEVLSDGNGGWYIEVKP